MGKKNIVKLEVTDIMVDRTQWKPYTSHLSGGGKVFVEIPLESKSVIDENGGIITLSVDGLADLMIKVADAITAADDDARIKKYGH